MKTTPADIDLWRQAPTEHQNLEFKEAKNTYHLDAVAEYCVAIANEGGGRLLLGISNDPPRRVVGSAAFSNIVKTAEELFVRLRSRFRVDIEQVQHPDGRVVVFHIPSRPRGAVYELDGTFLMRSGSRLVAMTEDRLRTIFAEDALPRDDRQYHPEDRAKLLLFELQKSRDNWLRSFEQELLASLIPARVIGVFMIGVPLTPLELPVLGNPELAPVMFPIKYVARETHEVEWPWAKEVRDRIPIVRGERRDYLEDTYALFERVYDDGTELLPKVVDLMRT
jgi:hypothetical protein